MMTKRGHTVIAGRPVYVGQHTDPLMKRRATPYPNVDPLACSPFTSRRSGTHRSDFEPRRKLFDFEEMFVCALWIVGVLGALTLLAMVQP